MVRHLHEPNRAMWNAQADAWARDADERGIWRRCHREPALAFSETELALLRSAPGADAAVLGSGDNEAAFALAGLGFRVTSVDQSERQLEIAARRAGELSLNLTFLRADVVDLTELADAAFDVVYTGGHVSVWVGDLWRYYGEAARILRPGGLFVVNEYHPFRRMWSEADGPAPRYAYADRGPHAYRSGDGLPQFEFHWTVAEHVQALLDAGYTLERIEEYGEDGHDTAWAPNVPSGLPANLLFAARKPRAV